MSPATRRVALAILTAALFGCDDRDEFFDKDASLSLAVGLTDTVAVLDPNVARIAMISAEGDQQPRIAHLPLGQNLATAQASADHATLLVLTRGVLDRRRASDEAPALSILSGGAAPSIRRTFVLPTPLSGLSVDPLGTFATVFAGAADGAFVTNPNELLVTRLGDEPSEKNPAPVTIRSFGSRPQRLSYTPPLGVPGGQHRLLLVETTNDLGIVDLEDLGKPDITVRLSSSGGNATPAGVTFSDGDGTNATDARIAIRLVNDRNVVLLDFVPQTDPTSPHLFRPFPNLVDVGGVATDIRFVRTDGGLRLAALVPSTQSLVLIDPATSTTTNVPLGAPYDHLSLVSETITTEDGTDVALVWSSSAATVAVVGLGTSVGTPYRSIEKLKLTEPLSAVLDVAAPNRRLKLLVGSSGRQFFVLDLQTRTAATIEAAQGSRIGATDDGKRATIAAQGQTSLAVVDLGTAHPRNVVLERPIRDLFDIQKTSGGRALIAVHGIGGGGLTLLDAESPSLESSREVHGLLLGGKQ